MGRRGGAMRDGFSALLLGLVVAASALAKITALVPLKAVVEEATLILSVKIEKMEPERPGMVLAVAESIKGKAPFQRLAVSLKGDAEAAKEKQLSQLLKRLAADLPLVLFVSQREKDYVAFAYSNGTWFQMTGREDGGKFS